MEEKLRKTSIDAVGNVPWGTHFCQFYQTKEDLFDILVPYFKAGLEDNEFCMWITSEPLNVKEVQKALKKKVKNLDDYIKKGQIEILADNQWYKKSEKFDPEATIQDFIGKVEHALQKGFDGLRIAGNSTEIERTDQDKFSSYEENANILIAKYKILAVCSYCLDNCSPSEIIDVVSNHKFTLIKQDNKWKIIQSSENKKSKEELQLSEERYALAQRAANIGSWDWNIETGSLHWSEGIEPLFGFALGEFGATYEAFLECVHPDDRQYVTDSVRACVENGEDYAIEHRIIRPNGNIRWVAETGNVIRNKNGKATRMLGVVQDITEHKKADEELKLHEIRLQALLDLNKMTQASEQMILDFVREEVIKVTQSQFAFIGFMNEDETVLTTENWSKNTMAQCAITDKPMDFIVAEAGLWGEPVRQRRPVIVNDYNAPHPMKKGLPPGHVPIERFLGIPVFDGDHIVSVAAVANKSTNYDESDIRAIESMMNDTWRLLKQKQNEKEIQNLAKFPSEDKNPVLRFSSDGTVIYANKASSIALETWGCSIGERIPDPCRERITKALESGGYEFEFTCNNGRIFSVTLVPVVKEDYVNAYGYDITERKDMEAQQQLAGEILECLNRESVGLDLIRDILMLIKKTTGFDAVGIRQQEEGDYPYFEVNGFPEGFVKAENHLCTRNEKGELILDSKGLPALECMCGVVLSGRTDPTLSFFTDGGSFWTNSTTELLTRTPQKAFPVSTRNRCNEAGYESVALIPLRSGDEIVGLLQLNDSRKTCFTEEKVSFFEEIGASIGIGLARIKAEKEVENLARFPSENPYPVLRIAEDGTILYANTAGSELLDNWDCKVNEQAPEHWQENILRTLKSGLNEKLEATCRDRFFSLTIAPVQDSGYVNVYGSDITERKHAEENLRKYRHQLEELVQTRTAELTETNKKLLEEIEGRKRLEKEILNISEREQKRIGQELHDSIGQQFTGIAFMMKVLEQKLGEKLPEEATEAVEIKKLVNQAMDQTRGLARGLHPVDLDSGSLILALQELAATTENLFGICCTVECDKSIPIDDAEVATHLYRITQEAITNAIKHGKTKNIRIELIHEKDKSILKVENDGLDFPEEFEDRGTGMGLQIMDHRADIIGASLDIHKAHEGGTILTCSFSHKTN
jgi:PAS domain S-box-containing protein